MGQKIHPTGFRLAVTRNWGSRWYAGNSNFASMLKEDLEVRAFLKKKLKNASVGRVLIERPAKNARITIFSSRPGVVIGKKGEDIEVLKSSLAKMMGVPVHVNIEEIRKPETDAQLIANGKMAA
jgi:small subunit ribosomal protein S3